MTTTSAAAAAHSFNAALSTSTTDSSRLSSTFNMADDSIFTAELDDVSNMSKTLQVLDYPDDHAVLVIKADGIRLITAGEKTFQVSAYFSATTFRRFDFKSDRYEHIIFRFMLKDFTETINILRDDPVAEGDKLQPDDGQANHSDGMKTSLHIQYRRKGDPLRMRLENKTNYVINCDLRAFNLPGDSTFCPLAFCDGEETAVIVMNSKRLYEYVSGMDLTSSTYTQLIMSRGDVPVRIVTRSTLLGEVELEITQNEKDIIKKDIVVSDNCLFSFSYKTQFIKQAMEALKKSSYVQMKCGFQGLLCVEHFHLFNDQKPTNNGHYMRPDMRHNEPAPDLSHQGQNKRSSLEYFILSEAKPNDACPD